MDESEKDQLDIIVQFIESKGLKQYNYLDADDIIVEVVE